MVYKALNELEGITCNEADGALYAFPRIRLSNKAKQAAEAKGVPPDEYYCIKVGRQNEALSVAVLSYELVFSIAP